MPRRNVEPSAANAPLLKASAAQSVISGVFMEGGR
ncbi:hypothetical protein BH160DRAFT_1115 [Burkholderia sp. H160]|nr:hypothetical protein BH160DRAFT_1115 [Burkholderia sp. H160]